MTVAELIRELVTEYADLDLPVRIIADRDYEIHDVTFAGGECQILVDFEEMTE